MINRHNYEEFFLMYVDEELSSQQRAEVEAFVQNNPDVEAEFNRLLQTKLSPADRFEFAHKNELLKQNGDAVAMNNYEEYFLQYIDNELSIARKEETELFVLQHPELQEEFTLLKQTVLPSEKIEFTDKASLLKRETKVIRFTWMRIAAAAVLILAVLFVWQMKNGQQGTIAIVTQNDGVGNTELPVTANKNTEIKEDQVNKIEDNIAVKQTEQKRKDEIQSPVEKVMVKEQEIIQKQEPELIALNTTKQKDDSKKLISNSGVLVRMNETTQAPDETINTSFENTNSSVASVNTTSLTDDNSYVQPAIYKELDTDADAANNALYVGSVQINKNKVRGLLKKVGGLFAGRSKNAANNEKDEKLQVAGFEINTN